MNSKIILERQTIISKPKYTVLVGLLTAILALFVIRVLANQFITLHTFYFFDTLIMAGALWVLVKYRRALRWSDWLLALILGAGVGVGMLFATLFTPYPFFEFVKSAPEQALLRGLGTILATLGGLAIMRQGGPVQFHIADRNWKKASWGVLVGLTVGLPLAALNVFALQLTQSHPIQWQNPIAALFDALQPAVVEEIIYRFMLWGLLWLILRNSLPTQSVWLAGLFAMLIHNYSHFDELFVQAPLVALGMGAAMALLWGLPLLILARCRGLESAIAFHWLQDAARFLAGF